MIALSAGAGIEGACLDAIRKFEIQGISYQKRNERSDDLERSMGF